MLGARRYTYTGTTMDGRSMAGPCRTSTSILTPTTTATSLCAYDRASDGVLLIAGVWPEPKPQQRQLGVMRKLFTAWGLAAIHRRHAEEC